MNDAQLKTIVEAVTRFGPPLLELITSAIRAFERGETPTVTVLRPREVRSIDEILAEETRGEVSPTAATEPPAAPPTERDATPPESTS